MAGEEGAGRADEWLAKKGRVGRTKCWIILSVNVLQTSGNGWGFATILSI